MAEVSSARSILGGLGGPKASRKTSSDKSVGAGPREKPGAGMLGAPVPQTDTGGRVSAYQGERVIPRQGTRQSGPVTSGEGAPLLVTTPCACELAGAAGNRPRRLFTKNT